MPKLYRWVKSENVVTLGVVQRLCFAIELWKNYSFECNFVNDDILHGIFVL